MRQETPSDLALVPYGMGEVTPSDLDPDGNGAPCEDEYDSDEIAGVYVDLTGHEITIRYVLSEDSDWLINRFIATGPAVDEGVMCGSGALQWMANTSPTHSEASIRIQSRLTCDDGSGTIVLGDDHYQGPTSGVWDYKVMVGVWTVVSGTGAYIGLSGGGGSWGIWIPDPVPPDLKSEDWNVKLGRLVLDPSDAASTTTLP